MVHKFRKVTPEYDAYGIDSLKEKNYDLKCLEKFSSV